MHYLIQSSRQTYEIDTNISLIYQMRKWRFRNIDLPMVTHPVKLQIQALNPDSPYS